MIFNVVISIQAEKDLRGIFEYIAFELLSLENAKKQLKRLERQILSLDEMPERFPRYGKEPWYSRGLRFVVVDHYIVFLYSRYRRTGSNHSSSHVQRTQY